MSKRLLSTSMPSEYLLDTNIAIFLFQNHPQVRSQEQQKPLRYLPFVTASELLFGAKRSGRREENLRSYNAFLDRFTILFPDRKTLGVYSDLRLALRKIGRPIPENDLWQAAIAIQHNAVQVTNDDHFAVVQGLITEDWTV